MSFIRKNYLVMVSALILIALLDTSYLTYKHFFVPFEQCTISIFGDCGKVLQSNYSVILGVPLALLGLVHYLYLGLLVQAVHTIGDMVYKRLLFIQSALGFIFSLYLVYLQFGVIGALCQYCLLSALISMAIYFVIRIQYKDEYSVFVLEKIGFAYKLVGKPLFFLISPEWVHEQALWWGEMMGKSSWIRAALSRVFSYAHPSLSQRIARIIFKNPIGLSAGYDYEAAFPRILPAFGFGFQTVGTITNHACKGNKKPQLGRLAKSKSLLVNKGFRNAGAQAIIQKLKGITFDYPLGISIGKTNLVRIAGTQDRAIADVVSAFKKFEQARIKNNYYELNISCPNLKGGVTFYPPKNLRKLLAALGRLRLTKPVFVKMPIEKTDTQVRGMLAEIVKHKWIKGVIFGNLQKNRKDPSFVKQEIATAGKGNFSGKPTYVRSNELIRLAYRAYGKKLVIIGCGGVFTAEHAYRKIRLGASLVQLITGMIFEGPQLISQINRELVTLLKQDGYKNISEAVGVDS